MDEPKPDVRAKAQHVKTITTPELRLRATVWVIATPTGNRYDLLLERGGSSWRYKTQNVKIAADNLSPRQLFAFLELAGKVFPGDMRQLLHDTIREADKHLKLDTARCPHCPPTGGCSWCGWTDVDTEYGTG